MPPTVAENFPRTELTSWASINQPNLCHYIITEKEVYACAHSVHSTAGGGAHGCLGQVMPPAEYIAHAGVEYIIPQHPGEWEPPVGQRLTANDQTLLLEAHKSLTKRAETAIELENVLKRMILKAVPERYVAVLQSRFTGAYKNTSVRQMLDHLRTTVATLTYEELQEEHDRLAATVYDPDHMEVSTIITDIRFLEKLAIAIENPYSNAQLMHLAIKIFTNCGYFSQGIRNWKGRPAAERNLENLDLHFVAEQKTLKELNPQGIGAIVGQHANVLQECTNSLLNQQQKFFDSKQQIFEEKQQQLTEMVLSMQQEHANFLASAANNNTTSGNKTTKKKAKTMAKKQDFGSQPGNENNPCRYYCWLHGANNSHPSFACKKGIYSKAEYPNFCAEATFEDRRGGSWKGSFES